MSMPEPHHASTVKVRSADSITRYSECIGSHVSSHAVALSSREYRRRGSFILDGTDMLRIPIEVRKATLASILRKSRPGVRLNEHLEHPEGALVFAHA